MVAHTGSQGIETINGVLFNKTSHHVEIVDIPSIPNKLKQFVMLPV